jgi:CRP/FNR family transcriptional activator FtrB
MDDGISSAIFGRDSHESRQREPSFEKVVRGLPIFLGLPAEVMDKLLALISSEQVPAKTVLIEEGEPQESLFILIEGTLQLFTRCRAHETTLAILRAPTLAFADVVPSEAVALASVRTLNASRVGRIAVPEARRLFDEERGFADAVTKSIAANWRDVLREYKNARTTNGLQRLVAWILAMQDCAETPSELTLPYDKAILASRLGMAPETLSRNLARLAALGVTIRGRRLKIHDARPLRALAAGGASTPPVP